MKQSIIFQRIEGGLIFIASLYFYLYLNFNLMWFIIFLFSIDVSMVGYLMNKVVGAYLYNLGHTYIVPVLLLIIGVMMSNQFLIAAALIWTAHIGFDRVCGYGLKFTTGFKDTHLGHIGHKKD